MRILYIGTLIPKKDIKHYEKYMSIAGNKFQNNMINSIKNQGNNIKILSYIQYPVFPNGKKLILPFKDSEDDDVDYIGYINFPILKNLSIYISTIRKILKYKNECDIIIAYNLFPPYLKAIMTINKFLRKKVGSVIADLYIDDYKYEGKIKRFIKKHRFNKEIKLLKKLDFCIPITNLIAKDFGFINPSLVVEGAVNVTEEKKEIFKKKLNENIIVYTGTLDSVNGIEILLGIAEKVEGKEKNIKILIAGDGPLRGCVEENANRLSNIEYLGRVSNEECLEIQSKADILILPRPTTQTITRYTFPSKLHEYMLSGTPVLITKLIGIPNEYNEFINFIKNEDLESIISQINDILNDYQIYKNKAIEGMRFVLESKSWDKQGERINEFLQKINDIDGK